MLYLIPATKTNPIRVLIADDHQTVRRGLAIFLETFEEFELVGEADNGEEAIRLCGETRPDVVLMDLMMPAMDGVAATRVISRAYPSVQIVALTTFGDQDLIQEALEAGAVSYVLKNTPIDALANAIREASGGGPAR